MSFNSKKYYGKRYDEISRYLEVCLESIKNQNYKNIEISVFDDCSEEDPSETIKRSFPDVKIIRNKENIGLLKTENKAIRESNGKYVLLLNQDIHLGSDYISKLVKVMENNKQIGAVSGKILRFCVNDENNLQFSKVIDSTGLQFFKDRNVIDRGQSEEDIGQYNRVERVFGITGAAPFYRREALEDIKLNNEYYDENFWMYKDDVDLCWRLNLREWGCNYCPQATAYHARSSKGISAKDRSGFIRRRLSIIKNRIIKAGSGSVATRRISFCNHYLMLVKNDTVSSILRSFFQFSWLEFQKVVFGILFEPHVYFPGWVDFFRKLAKIKKKRKIIQSRRTVSAKELEKLFNDSIW